MAAISRQQDARSVVLAGALVLVGTVVLANSVTTLTAKDGIDRPLSIGLLLLFGEVVVIVSILLTGYYTRGIHRLSLEVRDIAEPLLGVGARIETRLRDSRIELLGRTKMSRGGASTTFSFVYIVLTAFLGVLAAVLGVWYSLVAAMVVLPGLAIALGLSIDLSVRLLPFWLREPRQTRS